MKSIYIALGMAVILFFYGYALSTVGHDHNHHESATSAEKHPEEHTEHHH
jgi:hypothetical protein